MSNLMRLYEMEKQLFEMMMTIKKYERKSSEIMRNTSA